LPREPEPAARLARLPITVRAGACKGSPVKSAVKGMGAVSVTRRRKALKGSSNRLLTTMAIVRSNAETDRDYISNFEPFATDCLKSWPAGEAIEPEALSEAICAGWGIPSLPTAVGKILLRRAEERDEVLRLERELFPNVEKLSSVPELAVDKNLMLSGMKALEQAVVAYAREVHGLSWSIAEAANGLERLADEFGADLALARHQGGLDDANLNDDETLSVVYGFARSAIESNPTHFAYLEELVQGTMLVNAVYFPDVGHVSNRLKVLRVYLDTTPILRALDLADEAVCRATRQMLSLLREDFKVPLFVFHHTVDEIDGVLDGVAGTLRRGTRGASMQAGVGGRNREAIDSLVRRGATAGEIEALRSQLEKRMLDLGIHITEAPSHVEKEHIDEGNFDEVLDEVVSYRSKGPREKDLKSLTAIDRLRASTRPRDLSQANSLFVTANSKLVQASREFFGLEDRAALVPHAMHETALTAQLWVRAPHPPPDLPRHLLVADCYAALNPKPELWERWVQHIVRLQERGEVSDEQVQNLIYHQQAKSKLFEVTHGSPDAVNDETVSDVLYRFEAELKKPGRREADAERKKREEVEAERDRLRTEIDDLNSWREDQEALSAKRQERRSKARALSGYFGAALAILIFLIFAVAADDLHGKLAWAISATVTVFAATGAWAWAARRGWKFPFAALIFAGALSTLFVNVFSLAPSS